MRARILMAGAGGPLFDDCVSSLEAIGSTLVLQGEAPRAHPRAVGGARPADLVVAVLKPADLPEAALCDFFQHWADGPPLLAVLPESATHAAVKLAVRLADDFIVAPVRECELCHRAVRLLGGAAIPAARAVDAGSADDVKRRLVNEMALAGLVGDDPAFLKTLALIPLAARSNSPVLVVGETGTGKELCARAIHSLGPRAGAPFIPADCATLPDHLFENEMFGHSSGAYTDARRDQKGLVALAEGGTLFLDEIDALSMHSQAKLLRLLQERMYRPLGSASFLKMNANIVAATNGDLQALVRQNRFRADLYFRLNVLRLNMTPLRERRGDIPLLAAHLVARICRETGLPAKTLSAASLRQLAALDWPGNVRELHNTIQRALLVAQGPQLLPGDIFDAPGPGTDAAAPLGFREARSHAIESFERQYVEALMRECGGNVSLAARRAHKERRAFGRLVKRYEIARQFS